jgi:hypothetical protein
MSMSTIVEDVAILPERVKRELIRGENARAEFAIRAQNALQEAMIEMGPVRHVEGIGRKVATIHPEMAARIRVQYGVRSLHDPDFLRCLLKENPFLRVQTVPARLTVRVDGLRADSRRPEEKGNPQISQITQMGQGGGNGAQGDPASPRGLRNRRGSPETAFPRSGHETPSRPHLRQSAKSADGLGARSGAGARGGRE